MKQVAVMIVEDSRVVRQFLEHIIGEDPRLRVAASVGTAEEALAALPRAAPDVISLDIRLPRMNGLELTQRIMSERPTPIVVVSSDVEDDELKISMNALRAGALAVVQKPVGVTHADYRNVAQNICNRLFIMSQVRVIQQRPNLRNRGNGPPAPSPPKADSSAVLEVLGVVASTGGPNALIKVFGELRQDFCAPVLVVQHITPGFLRGFVAWLNELLPFPVHEAEHGQTILPGHVYVAPSDFHLVVASRDMVHLTQDKPVCMQRPSGTVLLRSMARVYGATAAGVVLTGMGEDGADGLREIAQAGGLTIAEHESTAVVYGMPAAAVAAGAASLVLPIGEVAARLNAAFPPNTARSP